MGQEAEQKFRAARRADLNQIWIRGQHPLGSLEYAASASRR